MPQKILITYEYFLPAYKAGGPIQSIANLCRQLGKEYQFYIICSSRDNTELDEMPNIIKDAWINFEDGRAMVYYISVSKQKRSTMIGLIKEINPDIVFINGIYSPLFSLTPIIFGKQKKILSVRGMLHPGALSQKKFKKKLFIHFLKFLGLHKKVLFHATDEKEKEFIQKVFGEKVNVLIAQNFPNQTLSSFLVDKEPETLRLVSVALISPMKNHALILEALKDVKNNVIYDIYGPIKDNDYWNYCLTLIKALPQNITVNYKGSIEPHKLENILRGYHIFILPSKSENFGHAIYEALSSGVPVITSYFTPWNNLQQNKAGYNVDIKSTNSITKAVEYFAAFTHDDFLVWSKNAINYAHENVDLNKISLQYKKLFSVQ